MSSSPLSASSAIKTEIPELTGTAWKTVCLADDLVKGSGICVLLEHMPHEHKQVAIFTIGKQEKLYAIENFDPFSKANVLSRGIVGSLKESLVVASPIFKQHFCLETGQCLEDDSVCIATFPVRLDGDHVQILVQEEHIK